MLHHAWLIYVTIFAYSAFCFRFLSVLSNFLFAICSVASDLDLFIRNTHLSRRSSAFSKKAIDGVASHFQTKRKANANFQRNRGLHFFFLGKNMAKGIWSACIGRATTHKSLISAIPLLPPVDTLSCWVSPLARFASP